MIAASFNNVNLVKYLLNKNCENRESFPPRIILPYYQD